MEIQTKTKKPMMGYAEILQLHADVLEGRLASLTENYADCIRNGKIPVRSDYQKRWILMCISRIYGLPEKYIIGKKYVDIVAACSSQPNFPDMEMMGFIYEMYSGLIHMKLSDVHAEFGMSKRQLCRCIEKFRSLKGNDAEKADLRYKFLKKQFLKLIF